MTDSFLTQRVPEPCILVIIGASGDLARRKLLPAIWHLAQSNRLPKNFALVGLARSAWSVEQFRNQIRSALHAFDDVEDDSVNEFLQKLHYVSGDLSDPETYHRLGDILCNLDNDCGTNGNRCFYCSVPPQAYLQIVERIGAAGLNREYSDQCKGWIRIVVEKPFGHDLESARTLNVALHAVFHERQIFRIDHYLGKETVQNILVFRLANSMFEPLWNRRYLDHVQITAAEAVGVEHRAEYYDQTGALRDMIQNHLLQVLCVIAMEPPSTFDSESVRLEKLKVLKSIRPFRVGQVDQIAVRAQYRRSIIGDIEPSGYLDEDGVASDSRTETFAATEFTIDNWRWQGVPFYVRTGKRMARRVTAVTLQFKQPPHLIFQHEDQLEPSRLTIRIQPEEGIALSFSGKLPGRDVHVGSVEMDFSYANTFGGRHPEAYETLILDSLLGDGTLFASSEWIEKSWELLMPILEAWGATSSTKVASYPAGSWGPIEAEDLFDRGWRTWINS